MRGLSSHRVALRDASLVVVASAALGLGLNALRADGIPLVATTNYQLVVPCPVVGGEAEPVAVVDVRWGDELVVDARQAGEHAAWAPPGAISVPYDFLDPVSDAAVADLLGQSRGASRLVVVGDGLLPDTGAALAGELLGRGVRGVVYVEGGAPAVRAHLGVAP